MTRQVNHLLSFLFVTFVFFLIGSITSCFSMAISFAMVFVDRAELLRAVVVSSGVSAAALLMGTLVASLAAGQIAQTLTDFGDSIGLEASMGRLWVHLALSSVFMMGGVFVLFFIKYRTPKIKAAAKKVRSKVRREGKSEPKDVSDIA